MTHPLTFHRVGRLLGSEALQRLRDSRVAVFGLGGVGGWTAEALVRTGVGHITLVDADSVAASNINRQIMATQHTVGKPKAELMAERMLQINPDARIEALTMRYDASTADSFDLEQYDVVIDAIDSLADKALLILRVTEARRPRFFSSMGAALKLDPTRVAVAEFWKVKGCRLAAALRNRFKRLGVRPRRRFQCVYSDELLPNLGSDEAGDTAMSFGKAAVNGAMVHITAIFGMTLAGLAVKAILKPRE